MNAGNGTGSRRSMNGKNRAFIRGREDIVHCGGNLTLIDLVGTESQRYGSKIQS